MKVKELMTPNPLSCSVGTDLASVARLMAKADCGALPVTDTGGKVIGIITDRDICIAAAAHDRPARQILAGAAGIKDVVYTCRLDDDVTAALERMKWHKVRRLPVVDTDGMLVGMLSWSDVALAAGRASSNIDPDVLIDAYRGICSHRAAAHA